MRIEKEKIRNWWNRNPCCMTNSDKNIGLGFFKNIEESVYNMHPWMREYFVGCKNKRILEVGCGMGRDLVQFARNGAIVTGIDLSDESIRLAKLNFKFNNLKGDIFVGDAENLVFPDNSFDMVYSYGVLHHTTDTQKAINEIYRVLKPEGKAIVMLYNKYSFTRLIHPNIREYESRLPDEREICPILKTFTTTEAKMMFSRFSSIKIDKRHIGRRFERFVPDIVKRRIGWHMIIEAIK